MNGIRVILENKNNVLVKSRGPLLKFIPNFLYFYQK